MFNTINEALEDIRNGKPVIIVDDENRENEGDLFIPAETISEEVVNFMVKEARGLMCVPLTKDRADRLGLYYMAEKNTDARSTVPIIAMTANAFEEDKQRAFDAGMNDHISKPISVNALLAALRKNLK